MTVTFVDGHPSPFAPTTEWVKYLRSLEQRGDPEKDLGLKAAIDQAERMIAIHAQQDTEANASTK